MVHLANPNQNQSTMIHTVWSPFQKIGFRFLFIFFLMLASPWDWIPFIGDFTTGLRYYPSFFVQNYILQLNDEPVWAHAPTGSGDTTDDWVFALTWLVVAIIGSAIWSILDRKRENYVELNYWFRTGLRYYISLVLFIYGFDKVFALQMPFPNLAQLNTPLGDLSPMRLAWLFIGYSTPYQFFGGLFETIAAILFAVRRTQLVGGLIMLGVLANVVILNFSYDIPVKLFSMQLFVLTLYVVLHEYKRLLYFFILNKPTEPAYLGPSFTGKRQKYIRWSLLGLFWIFGFGYSAYQSYGFWKQRSAMPQFALYGNYEVKSFISNGISLDQSTDTVRWNQLVIGNGFRPNQGYGLIKRGIHKLDRTIFSSDSLESFAVVFRDDSKRSFTGKYKKFNDREILLNGLYNGDSLRIDLVRIERQFKLETKPFHWISAYPY
jgi:hypothetical protein